MSEEPRRTDLSTVFEALADERRRLALYYLRDRGSTTLDELATVVSGWQRARSADRRIVTPTDRNRVRTRLHHLHLPKLADEGFVSYDRQTGAVTFDAAPTLLTAILDQSLELQRRSVGDPAAGDTEGRENDDERHTEDK